MGDILARALFFLLMVALGYAMKRLRLLSREDGVSLSKVVLYITLPCAIITGFRDFPFRLDYMTIPLISFLSNSLMLILGYAMTRGRPRNERVFYMLALPAYNIGNFTLPFVSGMLGTAGIVATCLFDMGNSPMCIGLDLVFTAAAIGCSGGRSPLRAVLSIFGKPSFTVYAIMLILSAFSLHLPSAIYDFASLISPANGPMSMVMIGLMLEFSMDRTKLREAVSANVLRLLLAAAISFLFFTYAPFPYEVRKAVAITAFAPISSASAAFTAELKGDVGLLGFASTVSIIISLLLMPLLFVLL